MNYFELFHIPQNYVVDVKLLQKQYLLLQAEHHPDKARNDTQRLTNLNQSMQINEAFKVLKDDYLRASHLLELNGQILDDIVLKNALTTDELEEILEQSELIENIKDLDSLYNLEKEKLLERQQLVEELGMAFSKNDIKRIIYLIACLKYLSNLLENVKVKIKSL